MRAPLEWTADPPGVSSARHLVAFRALVLVHWTTQAWAWVAVPPPDFVALPPAASAAVAGALSLLLGLSLWRPVERGRAACLLATPLAGALVVALHPFTPNHTFLAFVLLGLCAWLDPRRAEEEALLVQGLRWIAVLVLVWAGLQKVLHGLYFRGEFLAWMIGQGAPLWADLFGWMLPAEEVARLRALPRLVPGSGPYLVDSVLFVLLSNGVWIAEIAFGVGLAFARTREVAALAAIALVFTIQLTPREFMFALLYTQLLLLFVRGEPNRRLLPVLLAIHAWLLVALLGGPGHGFLLRASGDL